MRSGMMCKYSACACGQHGAEIRRFDALERDTSAAAYRSTRTCLQQLNGGEAFQHVKLAVIVSSETRRRAPKLLSTSASTQRCVLWMSCSMTHYGDRVPIPVDRHCRAEKDVARLLRASSFLPHRHINFISLRPRRPRAQLNHLHLPHSINMRIILALLLISVSLAAAMPAPAPAPAAVSLNDSVLLLTMILTKHPTPASRPGRPMPSTRMQLRMRPHWRELQEHLPLHWLKHQDASESMRTCSRVDRV